MSETSAPGRLRVMGATEGGRGLIVKSLSGANYLPSDQVFEKEGSSARDRLLGVGFTSAEAAREGVWRIVVKPIGTADELQAGDVLLLLPGVIWRPPLPD